MMREVRPASSAAKTRIRGAAARAAWWLATSLSSGSLFAAEQAGAPSAPWLAPALTYDGAAVYGLQGGLHKGSTYVGNLHLKLSADGGVASWPGSSAFLDVLRIQGGRPSRIAGDAQGVSNIEGPTGTQIEELWVQHNFRGSGASLLVGIYDLNSEFYRLQAAGLFLNSALGIGTEFSQAGVEGPSIFPRTAAGFRVAVKPTSSTVVRIALLDGVPLVRSDGSRALFRAGDGLLGVAEVALLSRPESLEASSRGARDRIGRFSSLAPYGNKLALGVWHFSGRFPDVTSSNPSGQQISHHGTSGVYAIGERAFIADEDNGGKRLSGFFHVGLADPRTNRFGSHLSAGLVRSGWGLFNKTDQAGLSVSHARNGSRYIRSQSAQGSLAARAETTVELSYLSQLSPHATVQPDLQYVRRPNTDPSIRNAWVLQLHFELSF